MPYIIDSSVFISANNCWYGIDFCPAFWKWLCAENQRRKLFSIKEVCNELLARDDQLSEWAREREKGFFVSHDVATLGEPLKKISTWVGKHYQKSHCDLFLSEGSADPIIVAAAMARGSIVVSLEEREDPKHSTKKVKIPDVCDALSVKHIRPDRMLRDLAPKFTILPKDTDQGV